MFYIAALCILFAFTLYQTVRQDDRLDKARGSVRFLLVLFMALQIAAMIAINEAGI